MSWRAPFVGTVCLFARAYASPSGCTAPLGQARTASSLLGAAGYALQEPSDVAFNPATHELYVTDHGSDSLIAVDLTGEVPTAKYLRDRARYHYMSRTSAIAFDSLGQYATCQESLNNYEGHMLPNFFMGPTLYDSRLPLVNSKQETCEPGDTCFLIHIDMLHEAPLCMGIAHDEGSAWKLPTTDTYRNVYWTFDGGSAQLVRFDFESDHGPGSMDHSLASVRRYTGLYLTRVDGVASHIVIDPVSRQLYVSDSGADRVVVVEMDTGYYAYDAKPIFPVYSSPAASFNYSVWHGIEYHVVGAVPTPSGLALHASYLFVSSYTTGTIYAFDRASGLLHQHVALPDVSPNSLMGLALDPTGALVYADKTRKDVYKLSVTTACDTGATDSSGTCANSVQDGDESGVDCGGTACARCAIGVTCTKDTDCASGTCSAGVCAASARTIQTSQFLWNYLDSDFYANSFAHHLIHGDMGGASYLNPYPIMEDTFCAEVGMVRRNFSLVNGTPEIVGPQVNLTEPDCSLIDFDSLLLGGCWCHPCLPENPCGNGTCVNYQFKGYTCDCDGTGMSGDHCEVAADGARSSTFPWYKMPAMSPAAPPSPSPPPPTAPPGSNDTVWIVPLVTSIAVFGWLLVMVVLWKRSGHTQSSTGTRTSSKADGEVYKKGGDLAISPPLSPPSMPPSPPGSFQGDLDAAESLSESGSIAASSAAAADLEQMQCVGEIGRKVAWGAMQA